MTTRMMRTALTMSLASSIFVACGKKDDNKAMNSGSVSELEGTWGRACQQNTDISSTDQPIYSAEKMIFSGSKITQINEDFLDATCTTRQSSNRVEVEFSGGTAVTVPDGAKTLDTTGPKWFFTLHTDALVEAYNGAVEGQAALCGGGFVKGVEKEMTKEACKGTDFEKFFESGYGIYKIEGAVLKVGESGDDGSATDGSTADKRPTKLDENAYTKA